MNEQLRLFNQEEIRIVDQAAFTAEEMVTNYYKMSTSQWLQGKYDVVTLVHLSENEIIHGPFAQIVRYKARKRDSSLGSTAYDFYKICLQDHAVLAATDEPTALLLFPLILYIISHELIHIVRFSKFLQNFDATDEEKLIEERRVHEITNQILASKSFQGIENVLNFYRLWRDPIEGLRDTDNMAPSS